MSVLDRFYCIICEVKKKDEKKVEGAGINAASRVFHFEGRAGDMNSEEAHLNNLKIP